MSLSVGVMVTFDAGWPSVNGGEFIEITLQFWAREAFDVTNQVTVLCLKSLEGPCPDQRVLWASRFHPFAKKRVAGVLL